MYAVLATTAIFYDDILLWIMYLIVYLADAIALLDAIVVFGVSEKEVVLQYQL